MPVLDLDTPAVAAAHPIGAAHAATQRKRTGAHFTPPELADFVARVVKDAAPIDSLESVRVLDPACGDGELLVALADKLPARILARTIITGVELDSAALREARRRLAPLRVGGLDLREADFLTLAGGRCQYSLFDVAAGSHAQGIEPADVIIANPPYVRTQVLGSKRSRELADLFALSGRVDLYQAFLVAMTRCLAPGGVLGVITSNRFLSTRSGSSVREFLHREYDIVEVIDLGDTKLFDAAVLPAVFVGRKRMLPTRQQAGYRRQVPRFVRIYEQEDAKGRKGASTPEMPSVCDALMSREPGDYRIAGRYYGVASGPLAIPDIPSEPWGMATASEQAWLRAIEGGAAFRIRDVAKVRVGIKTCADNVFIRTDWESLPESKRPEGELLRPLLSHEDAGRWTARTILGQQRRIAYTHEMRDGKRKAVDLRQYPGALAYFEAHRPQLEGRAYVLKARRNWYEIWVPQQPDAWRPPKVVFPDISPEPKFFFDDRGCLVDGNCYWITVEGARDPDLLFLIQAVANSALMTRYHDASFNNKLYAGRRRYLTQYVERYPLPDPTLPASRHAIALAKELVFGGHAGEERARRERALEAEVMAAFGMSAEPCS